MDTITLCPESVSAYKELMTNPKANGLDMPSLAECFEEAESGTAKHILFKEYLERIGNKPLPKVFFYIVMDELHSNKIVKCADGNIGYKLKLTSVGEKV